MNGEIRVTVWNEFRHEKENRSGQGGLPERNARGHCGVSKHTPRHRG